MPRSDKGSKRPGYDASRRKALAQLRRTLESVEWWREAEGRELVGRHRQPGRPRKERRRMAREGAIPADRKCPQCGALKLKSRQWVVGKHKLFPAVCISCARTVSSEGSA